ncbi:hypothetical protein BAU15_04355 [Enterococcus sp. JM4C]|uniref:ComF family protein n=1 Tax=Candidatus Enterococcus huntleyi TaxID=1857217 RepID=UPI0013798A6A|nr:ComF family protein [Enterococcus sp. JM4C]KAF1295772.1 hypothetical protein BAU15_04355 [Enterococcus sp. JM4C]
MKCSYCKEPLVRTLSLAEILGLVSIPLFELCSHCTQLFHQIDPTTACPGCGRDTSMKEEPGLCADCLYWQKRYPTYSFKNRALFRYDYSFKEWISSYKFSGDYQLRGTFSERLKRTLSQRTYKNTLICPLPLSIERQKQRGFNQVEGVLLAASIPFVPLLKRLELAPQSGKTRQERLLMPQPYVLAVEKAQIKHQSILLIDDVYTTGRTLFHAAECLRLANPAKVESLTFAR